VEVNRGADLGVVGRVDTLGRCLLGLESLVGGGLLRLGGGLGGSGGLGSGGLGGGSGRSLLLVWVPEVSERTQSCSKENDWNRVVCVCVLLLLFPQ